MANTVLRSRSGAGRPLKDRGASGQGFQASSMQATQPRGWAARGQKIPAVQGHPLRSRPAVPGQQPSGDSPYPVRRRHALPAPRDGLQWHAPPLADQCRFNPAALRLCLPQTV